MFNLDTTTIYVILDKATLQCELCKNVTPKHNAYICESGHTICVNCDDSFNFTHVEESEMKIKITNIGDSEENIVANDLAGGDCVTRKSLSKIPNDKNAKTETRKNIDDEIDKRDYVKKNFRYTTPVETTFVYKNLSYDNNESMKSLLPYIHDINNETEIINVRPIICPILHCKRTVAFHSILKHFSFDHSEIPTLPITVKKTLKIYLKPKGLSKHTKCVAIINPIGIKSTLLLMAAKIVHANWTIHEEKQLSGNQLDSDLCSQNKRTDADLNKNDIKELHEDIIIWICRLTELKQVCCVKVKRDNILGYSYIGEGLYIQSQPQDAISVFQSPECLILRYYSIPKLLDDHGQIHVYINILN